MKRDFYDMSDDFDNDSFNDEEENYDPKKLNETIKSIVKKYNSKSYNSLWDLQELPIEESFTAFKENIQEIRIEKGRIKNFEINSKVYQHRNGLEKLKVSISLYHTSSDNDSRLKINIFLDEIDNSYSVSNLQFI
jgi:hypothetical protein